MTNGAGKCSGSGVKINMNTAIKLDHSPLNSTVRTELSFDKGAVIFLYDQFTSTLDP